ncbi:MAG: M20/M25/M40 family metallo-hydrolase, partial [Clostridia bacterium]|nr:M20/M25/M40 family metallo-hydrolase [Clostridia bacterium]
DALPIEDCIDAPYKSTKPGVGHKCGHDGHTASLCALAMDLEEFGGERDVYMLFQPAEETGTGAAKCVDFITDNNIAEMYGMHGSVEDDFGTVVYRDGLMNCASEGMCVKYKGAHAPACLPEWGRNPSYALSKLALASEELAASDEYEGLVMATIVHIGIGNKDDFGTAAYEGIFQATIRGESEAEMKDLEKKLEAKAKALAEEYSLEVEVSYSDYFPETINDAGLNKKLLRACEKLNLPAVIKPEAERGSGDFGHYAKHTKVTTYFVCMGKGKPDTHTTGFDFDDDIIGLNVDIYRNLINDF